MLDVYKQKILLFSSFIIYPFYAYEQPFRDEIIKYLEEKGAKNIDEILGILIYPDKKNFGYREQKRFLNLVLKTNGGAKSFNAQKLQNNRNVRRLIENHIYEFGWIQCRNYHNDEWTFEEMIERIKTVLPDARKDLERLAKLDQTMKNKYQRIVKKHKVNGRILQIIKLSKELVYYRTYRTDVFHKSGFNIRNLLEEIGKRFGLTLTDLIHLRIEEIFNLSEQSIDKRIIEERKRGFALLMIKGKMNWFWGKELRKYKTELLTLKRSQSRVDGMGGTVANKGRASGQAKIIRTAGELRKVKRGDILVAPMTFPSFIPAMEKAAAFVTDEGGILCHAAIISREMNKPCVINTKNATRIIRDGDFVEVDAEYGAVKIIKRAQDPLFK